MLNNIFYGRSLLNIDDFSADEINYLIDFAIHLKYLKKNNIKHEFLAGKNIALLFEKPSTRTRSSFVIAINDLGGHSEYLGTNDIHFGDEESVSDTAKVLGSMYDGIEFRGFKQQDVETLSKYSGVPVWNGLTDDSHPTQMLADFMTMKEKFGKLEGLTLTYVGDGRNNMANSLLITAALLGVNVHIVAPKSLFPSKENQELAQKYAQQSGAEVLITDDVDSGVKDSNVLYTDVWVSMGEDNWDERIQLLKPYQVNMEMIEKTGMKDDEIIFMHCLPSFHDNKTTKGQYIEEKYGLTALEVSDEVFNSKYAWQFTEAENRMHSIKAIVAVTLGNLFIPKA
ncbi:ornithine carbamoyltransferase [Apilactobacillus sp. 1-1-2]|uniref:ornithine carbamoyltransferase n=1 Tax=Apilactobacillus sp. 1-1-2 TaxID=3411035 RepID=UPI003B93F2B8